MYALRVGNSDFGRGLFIEKDLKDDTLLEGDREEDCCVAHPGDTIFVEIPTETIPLEFSRLCHRICSVCLRPLGTIVERAQRIFHLHSDRRIITDRQTQALRKLWATLIKLGHDPVEADEHVLGCKECDSSVCSSECFQVLLQLPWHRITCPSCWGPRDGQLREYEACELTASVNVARQAWLAFVRFARRHFDGFILAARLICRIAAAYETHGPQEAHQVKATSLSYHAEDFTSQWAPIHVARLQCSDMPVAKDKLNVTSVERSCRESFALLKTFFRLRGSILQTHGLRVFCTDAVGVDNQYYERLLIQFERVNADVALEDPLLPSFDRLLQRNRKGLTSIDSECLEVFKEMYHVLFPAKSADAPADMIRRIFSDVLAYSYAPIVGLLNHSCTPNVSVDFLCRKNSASIKQATVFLRWTAEGLLAQPFSDSVAKKSPFLCHISALRELHHSDQLFLSYIDEEEPLVVRARQLRTQYNFVCRCSKCYSEALEERRARHQ